MGKYNLCISLNQKEKALIIDKASKLNLKPTEYARKILLDTESDNKKPVMFIPPKNVEYKIGSKKKSVKAYFTDNEMKAIEHMAKGESLSGFVSRRALQGEHVLKIEINDDDYNFVYSVIEPLYNEIYLYLYGLKGLNEIKSADIEHFISELEKSNNHLVELTEYFKKNRASIRKSRLRHLIKLTDFYLKDYELISVEE